LLNLWFLLAIFFMAINWLAVWFGWNTANYITKPGIILALLGWFFSNAGFSFPALWFGIGLVFALVGDTLLMFKGKAFLFGMAAFMGTHIAYIIGFDQEFSFMNPGIYATAMIVFSLWMLVFATLRKGALPNPEYRKMEVPLIGYNLLILAMVISALTTNFRTGWQPISVGLVSCGAVLFLFSDALLAFDRFIQPLPTARLWKRVTYQLGQLAIIAGVLITFSA
jgi:uncharacterized membrane protein YhhN